MRAYQNRGKGESGYRLMAKGMYYFTCAKMMTMIILNGTKECLIYQRKIRTQAFDYGHQRFNGGAKRAPF